jgi:hypothetical protein
MAATSRTSARWNGAHLLGLYLLALALCVLGNLAVRVAATVDWVPAWCRGAIGLLSAGPLVVSAALFWRVLRRDLDELWQRVLLEGMAFALVLFVPLAALYVNLRAAGLWTPRLDPPDLLLTPALLVAFGVVLAWRRYQ